VKAGDTYYVCHQGVWFSGQSPTGPFAVTDKVPEEIYKIPPSSPVYSVTYVNVYDSDDDAVLFGFTAGYVGGFIAAGILTWGTGYWYRPWIGPYYGRPVYFGRPYTYGAGVHFSAWGGAYYRGGAAYGPYGGIGASARYNPATGRYSRGVAAYGPYQRGAAARAYNPRTGVAAASYQRAKRALGRDGSRLRRAWERGGRSNLLGSKRGDILGGARPGHRRARRGQQRLCGKGRQRVPSDRQRLAAVRQRELAERRARHVGATTGCPRAGLVT
jgi:hypothetical protein